MNEDLLETLLRAALAEGALDADSLPRFAEALRARAALILADRVLPIAERAGAFETESTWRAEVMAGFEEEKRTWHEAHDRLLTDREAQVAEVLALKQEREALQDQERRWMAEREAQANVDRLTHLNDIEFRDHQIEALKAELEAARREKDVASAVHDRLLAHHRASLAHVAGVLDAISRDLPWRYRRARAAVLELLRLLDKDTP